MSNHINKYGTNDKICENYLNKYILGYFKSLNIFSFETTIGETQHSYKYTTITHNLLST